MGFPSFSAFPPVPQRSAPEADFDAKMYALFRHFADTHRAELLAFIAFLEANSTVIGAALNDTTIGLATPAAAKFTTVEAERLRGPALLGAVSQDAGVPTGAVVERGSNANGDYMRFADGTQICTASLNLGLRSSTTAAGGLHRSDVIAANYPAAFAATPAASISAALFPSGIMFAVEGDGAQWRVRAARPTPFEDIDLQTVRFLAVGRWF